MPDPVDLPELRRLAEAALRRPDSFVGVLPEALLALLDRIDALEAVVTGDGSGHHLPPFDPRALRTDQVHIADPGAVAGEPESEETTGGA